MTETPQATVSLHHKTGRVRINGRALPLQHKAQRVLRHLVLAAPRFVTRSELIDDVWSGNHFTGEKGLTQAIWAIRSALHDRASAPRFIRTIPREGYQWVAGPVGLRGITEQSWPLPRQLFATFAVAALAIGVAVSIPASSVIPGTIDSGYPMEISAAHLRGDYIVVDFTTGCRGLIKAEATQQFGSPVVSTDRKQILFRVLQENTCELVLFESEHRRIRKFSSCPLIESDITT